MTYYITYKGKYYKYNIKNFINIYLYIYSYMNTICRKNDLNGKYSNIVIIDDNNNNNTKKYYKQPNKLLQTQQFHNTNNSLTKHKTGKKTRGGGTEKNIKEIEKCSEKKICEIHVMFNNIDVKIEEIENSILTIKKLYEILVSSNDVVQINKDKKIIFEIIEIITNKFNTIETNMTEITNEHNELKNMAKQINTKNMKGGAITINDKIILIDDKLNNCINKLAAIENEITEIQNYEYPSINEIKAKNKSIDMININNTKGYSFLENKKCYDIGI